MKQVIYASFSKDITKLELDNRYIAYKAASEAIVLLKNDGILPLKEDSLALFGSGARKTIKGGTGSGEVNERYSVSIYSGLLNKGFNITSNKWLDDYDLEFKEALDLLAYVKKPLLVPSANRSDHSPARTREEVVAIFSDEVKVVVPGQISSGEPSTIVDLTGPEMKLIRKGPIPFEELNQLI